MNGLKTALLLGLLTGILLVIGFLIGGVSGLTIALVIALVLNLISYWYSDKIVLKMYRAKEADKDEHSGLYNMVKTVSESANVPMPKVYIVPNEAPNAFATGRNPKNAVVAVTSGILNLLNERELKGVIAHEMAHIKNRDILVSTIAAVIAGAISYLAMMARFGAIFGGGDDRDGGGIIGLLALSIIAPIAAMVIHLAISRSREYLADSTGAGFIKDPDSLADALQKLHAGVRMNPMKKGNQATSHMFIVNPFSTSSLTRWLSTHPSVESRVGRLRSMSFKM